jgi:predicted metal-dependent HD superfamily phosphohydrolase
MAALDTLLDCVPVSDATRADLRARLQEPSRSYHNARHVALLWKRHLRYGAGLVVTAEPWHRLIASAIAFHDAVHDPRRRDNEAASAALWRRAQPSLSQDEVEWVAGTIEATASHLSAVPVPGMPEAAWTARLWMLDLDLTPLAEHPAGFAANTKRLRREAAHLPEAEWEAARLDFLRRIAAAPRLFRSDALAAAFERRARANITRQLVAVQWSLTE